MRAVLSIPPGLNSDDTTYRASGRWADSNNVRFDRGAPQTIGGWESIVTDPLAGVCRGAFGWTDNIGGLNIAFGTHRSLDVWTGGVLADITPGKALPGIVLPDRSVRATDAAPLLTISLPSHGLQDGEEIELKGESAVGRIVLDGRYVISVLDEATFSITAALNADLSKTLATNPLAVESGKPTVTVTEATHRIADGATVTIAGAANVGGINPNGAFVVTRIDADRYRYSAGANATSTATGGGAAVVATVPEAGGGGAVLVPQRLLAEGAVDGTGGAGYGTGAYSTGGYSEPSAADYFPRTWALGAWGQQLLASPRGGTIYLWENDPSQVAEPLMNAPARVSHMVVAASQEMLFALGCNEEVSRTFNPACIRHCSVRKNWEWHTAADTTAREYILPGGGRIVAGRAVGSYLLVWTNHSLFLGSYVGSLGQPWRFDRIAEKCGLIGPNAAVVVNQAAYWLGVDGQFYRYGLGGGVEPVPCPIRDDLFDHLTPSQADKIVASSISRFSEVRWDYPDARDGVENSRYVALSLSGQGWYRGRMARSAFTDAGPSADPIGVAPDGRIYWHERGHSADGRPLDWSLETADLHLGAENTGVLLGVWPDVERQIGVINFSIASRLTPQGGEKSSGPFAFAAGARKIDLRSHGRLFRLRFEGSSLPSFARFGELSVQFEPAGER